MSRDGLARAKHVGKDNGRKPAASEQDSPHRTCPNALGEIAWDPTIPVHQVSEGKLKIRPRRRLESEATWTLLRSPKRKRQMTQHAIHTSDFRKPRRAPPDACCSAPGPAGRSALRMKIRPAKLPALATVWTASEIGLRRPRVGRPIFIVSMPRSGSSWIGALLGAGQEVQYYREPYSRTHVTRTGAESVFAFPADDPPSVNPVVPHRSR